MTPSEAHEWLFQRGWVIMAELYDWPDKKARTFVGKLIKEGGDQLAQRAIVGIQDKKPVNPLPWALAGFRVIQAKAAWKHRPSHRPPPVAPGAPISAEERHRGAARLAKFRAELEGM